MVLEQSGVMELPSFEEGFPVDHELLHEVEAALHQVDAAFEAGDLPLPQQLTDPRRDQKGPNGPDGLKGLYHRA